MNTTIKGSIAGLTGIALLMGGFGTYALWTDDATLERSEVASGELDISGGPVVWKDRDGAAWSPGDLIVPGDTVTRSQDFTFTRAGKNLTGTIRIAGGATTERSTGAGDDFTVDVAVDGYRITTGGDSCWAFTATSGVPDTVRTTVTYALTADAQDLQDTSASMTETQVVVQQGDTC